MELGAITLARQNRDITADEDITGPYREAALLVRRYVGNTASVRGIELKTGVNYRTIDNMMKGAKADSQNVIRFARAYKFNPNRLLSLYQLDQQPEFDLVEWSSDAAPKSIKIAPEDDERIRMRILTEFDVVGKNGETRPVQMNDLSPQMRRRLAEMLMDGEFDGPGLNVN